MFKKIPLIALVLTACAYPSQYYAKVEPFQEYVLKSNVSGRVVFSKIMKEKQVLSEDEVIVQIDTEMDNIELDFLQKKVMIADELAELKKRDSEAFQASAAKSAFEKRQSRQSYLSGLLNKYDVRRAIKALETTIERKTILLKKDTYIDRINVVKDDYVIPGTVLLSYSDINKTKLKVYVGEGDYKDIDKKKIYIEGKHYPEYSISKKSLVKDKDKLSMFEIELIGVQNGFMFGDMVSVEFR